MVDGGLGGPAGLVELLEVPRVAALVVHQPRVVVALVQVLEDRREDLRLVVGQVDALARSGFRVLVGQCLLKPWRCAEHVFVGREDALVSADDEGYDGWCQAAVYRGRKKEKYVRILLKVMRWKE